VIKMKLALIDPTSLVNALTSWEPNTDPQIPGKYIPIYTPIEQSARVCQVVDIGASFPIAPPYFWASCSNDVVADQWYYNTQTEEIIVVPAPAPFPGTNGVQGV
jgi:hypothetical protein